MNSSPEFDNWFSETHGTPKQPITSRKQECDSCVEDVFTPESDADIDTPLDSGFILS